MSLGQRLGLLSVLQAEHILIGKGPAENIGFHNIFRFFLNKMHHVAT